MAIELKERGPTLYLYSLSETVYLTISQYTEIDLTDELP